METGNKKLSDIFRPAPIKSHPGFSKLSDHERWELLNWMMEHPGEDGGDWPGWDAVMQRPTLQ